MCRKESISFREVSAANLLVIRAANSGQVRELVLMPVLLSQWSALPTRNTLSNFTLLCTGVSANAKHFSACLSQPFGFSPSNYGQWELGWSDRCMVYMVVVVGMDSGGQAMGFVVETMVVGLRVNIVGSMDK
jgi:hypothetical protein